MIRVQGGTHRSLSRLWACLVAVQILICLGTGLVSIALPEDSNLPAGYYDGDGDDAVTTSERLGSVVDLTLDARAVVLPARMRAALGIVVASVSPPHPGRSQPPLLRSPPA